MFSTRERELNCIIRIKPVLKQYWTFCQDSAGFMPETWLDDVMHPNDVMHLNKKYDWNEKELVANINGLYDYLFKVCNSI